MTATKRKPMFNSTYQFYPTPADIAAKMVEPYAEQIAAGAIVLDPSAGAGALLDAAHRHGRNKSRLYAVEIDQNLQALLKGKNYKVVGDDWMQYAAPYHFDVVLMNPPFAAGEHHLLRAWEIIPAGGDIACLLNSETLSNPYSAVRELLAGIVKAHGTTEDLGPCFEDADRKTKVNVTLVRLKKPGRRRFAFKGINTGAQINDDDIQEAINHAPARRDLVGSLVQSFNDVTDALEQFIKARQRLHASTQDFWRDYYSKKEDEQALANLIGDPAAYFNLYMEQLQQAAWWQLFRRTNMRALMTERVRKDWDAFQAQQGAAQFTHENIMAFFDLLIANRNDILGQCVVDVFDRMCSYDKKNKIHFEGWKTNSAYRVNRKVILPWFIEPWKGSWGVTLSVNHRKYDQMDDIDRALCLISGRKFPESYQRNAEAGEIYTIKEALQDCLRKCQTEGGTGECEFFTFRYFKKGTVHLQFKDEYIWQEFNRRAAQGKGWLGDGD